MAAIEAEDFLQEVGAGTRLREGRRTTGTKEMITAMEEVDDMTLDRDLDLDQGAEAQEGVALEQEVGPEKDTEIVTTRRGGH